MLGGADQALGNSDLVGCLPGVAGCLAIRVAGAVRGHGGDRADRRHPLCGVPPFVDFGKGSLLRNDFFYTTPRLFALL